MPQSEQRNRAVAIAREFNVFDPSQRAPLSEEHERLALLQQELPAMFCPAMGSTGQWWFSGYDEVREALEQSDLFVNNTAIDEPPAEAADAAGSFVDNMFITIPEHTDAPEHAKYRRPLNALFAPQKMAELEGSMRAFANDLLDPLVAAGGGEFMEGFCVPFPTRIFTQLAGWPMEDYERLMWWNTAFFMPTSKLVGQRLPPEDLQEDGRPTPAASGRLMQQVSTDVYAFLQKRFAEVRRDPKDDLMSQLLELEYEGERPLTDDELNRIGFVMFLGGLDTVANMLVLILWDFARHPEHRRKFIEVMDDDAAVMRAINELSRYNAITSLPRRVSRDCTFRGLELKKNDIVNLDTCTASRDPERFERPDELDFDRPTQAHFGFGHGRHRCLGIHLAKLELKVALQELHRRMPDYTIVPGRESRTKTQLTRGLENLDLVIG